MKPLEIRCAKMATAMALTGACAWAQAAYVEVTVQGTAGPWNWNGGLNAAFAYGPVASDFTAPATIGLASIGSGDGQEVFIAYKSGLTSAFGGPPVVDQTGHILPAFKDDAIGSSGGVFPSYYMPSQWGVNQAYGVDPVAPSYDYGVFLNALVGAFTDAAGTVLDPFAVGAVVPMDDGSGSYYPYGVFSMSRTVVAGAFNLQLGLNDDVFVDNTGALQVCVGSSLADVQDCLRGVAQQVPEPGSLALFGLGLGLAAVRRRRGG